MNGSGRRVASVVARLLRLRIASIEALGRSLRATRSALCAARLVPGDADLAATALRHCVSGGRWDEATAILRRLPDSAREHPGVVIRRAALASARDDAGQAIALLEGALRVDPRLTAVRASLATTLARSGRYGAAEEHITMLERLDPSYDVRSMHAMLLDMRFRREEALALTAEIARRQPEDVGLQIDHLARLHRLVRIGSSDPSVSWDDHAEARLAALLARHGGQPRVRRLALEVAVGRRDVDAAERLLRGTPGRWRHRFVHEGRAWVAHHRGRPIEEVRRLWAPILRHHHVPHLRPLRSGELQPEGRLPSEPRPDRVTLFAVVRDEASRLGWFLDHHRGLGVERFIVVDNGSTDGTRELLREQPDVHLFRTSVSFREGRFGMVWLNHLMHEFGSTGWNLYADADEAMVFPDCESIGLPGLVRHLDRHGHEAVKGLMVDLHSDGPPAASDSDGETDPIRRSPLLDIDYTTSGGLACPYSIAFGGARRRLGAATIQTKTPLVRGGRGIRYLSNHTITPARVSDVTCALLHFKLTGDAPASFLRWAEEGRNSPFARRRNRAHAEALSRLDDGGLGPTRTTTVRYHSSRTLVEHGILEVPGDARWAGGGQDPVGDVASGPAS